MKNLLERTKKIYHEYPSAFWTYNLVVFIDRLGGFMLYPFFALYLTQKYDIGMSTVGILFAVFSVSGMVGSALGGAVADRMGRKTVIIFSLLLSSLIKQLENFAGVMNFVIFPMFFASNALNPLWRIRESSVWLYYVCAWNPFTHAVELIRFTLNGKFNGGSLLVVLVFLFLFLAGAIYGYDPSRGIIARRGGPGGPPG